MVQPQPLRARVDNLMLFTPEFFLGFGNNTAAIDFHPDNVGAGLDASSALMGEDGWGWWYLLIYLLGKRVIFTGSRPEWRNDVSKHGVLHGWNRNTTSMTRLVLRHIITMVNPSPFRTIR